jgi:hypothetical protein
MAEVDLRVANHSAERAILDVSMIAHPAPLSRMMTLAKRSPDALSGLVVSDAFVRAIEERKNSESLMEVLHRQFRVSRHSMDVDFMRMFIDSAPFRQFVTRYRRDSPADAPMLRALRETTGDEWAGEVMFEEWEYLMNHSWLFSKTRAIYDHVVDAGSNALYVTKKKLEQAVRATKEAAEDASDAIVKGSDALVGKTIKKSTYDKISPNDRVRALAKWVAVGGSAATSLMVPIAGVAVGTVTGLFLLYDP